MSIARDYGTCRNARTPADARSTAIGAKRVLERAEEMGSGALMLKGPNNSSIGAILIERGRLCWAVCNACPRRLSDILVEESSSLTNAQVTEVVRECRQTGVPLGETLLSRGMVSQEALHRALLHHTSVALDHLIRADGEGWTWVAHTRQGYSPILTFSATEVLVEMTRLFEPEQSAQAAAVLQPISPPWLSSLALRRVAGGRTPIAQVRCEHVELASLSRISRQADEILSVASIAALRIAILEMSDLSFAAWGEDANQYVLLCKGKLAFNRLLAHISSLNII
ncbi:MAG: hypothetical protein R3B48_07755 [Kofleriaceae bacterium]